MHPCSFSNAGTINHILTLTLTVSVQVFLRPCLGIDQSWSYRIKQQQARTHQLDWSSVVSYESYFASSDTLQTVDDWWISQHMMTCITMYNTTELECTKRKWNAKITYRRIAWKLLKWIITVHRQNTTIHHAGIHFIKLLHAWPQRPRLTAVGSIKRRRRKSKQRQPAAVDIHPTTRGHYGAGSSQPHWPWDDRGITPTQHWP